LFDKAKTTLIQYPAGKLETSYVIPNSITNIETYAFAYCSNFTSIIIPNTVISIGRSAFYACPNLTDVTTPFLSSSSFSFTDQLKKLTVTSACTSMPAEVLANCTNLTELSLPFIGTGSDATGESGILGILFGTSALSNAVTQYYAEGVSNRYAIPRTLEKLTITLSASRLEFGALSGCSMLKELILPSSLTGLAQKALSGCSGLEDIYSQRALPPSCNANTFEEVNKFSCKLHVPSGSKQYYSHDAATGWKDFIFIEEETATGINNPLATNRISIYPNPVSDNFRISGILGATQVTVTDITGKTVLSRTVNPDGFVSVSHLQKGIYLVHVNGKAVKMIKR
jgi:hypothetical protein